MNLSCQTTAGKDGSERTGIKPSKEAESDFDGDDHGDGLIVVLSPGWPETPSFYCFIGFLIEAVTQHLFKTDLLCRALGRYQHRQDTSALDFFATGEIVVARVRAVHAG